jgi:hypothetical protein
MKATFIDEPELEFGSAGKHVDIRFGLATYGPLDADLGTAPSLIRLGVVGTQETVEGIHTWLTRCASGITPQADATESSFPLVPWVWHGHVLPVEISIR